MFSSVKWKKQYFSISVSSWKKINVSLCKKNKYRLLKPEKKKTSTSTGKYTKTEKSNTKTVTPSSSCSSANSSASLLRKKQFPPQGNRNRNLSRYFESWVIVRACPKQQSIFIIYCWLKTSLYCNWIFLMVFKVAGTMTQLT